MDVYRKLLLCCLVSQVGLFSTEAQAKEQEEYQLDTITVTAEKREDDLQKLPATVTAVPATELEDAEVKTVSDVMRLVPNVSFSPSQGVYQDINIRGIGSSMFTHKNPVVIMINGVPFDSTVGYDLNLLDLERVEVLRGPQGTLYGKNAIGGVINVISKKPDNTLRAGAAVELDENQRFVVSAQASGPIVDDTFFVGLTARLLDSRGYMENEDPSDDYFDSESSKNFHGTLRWMPADNLEVNAHADVAVLRNDSDASIGPNNGFKYSELKSPDDRDNADLYRGALSIHYEATPADIYSVTTYNGRSFDFSMDRRYTNPTPNPGMDILRAENDSTSNSFTQEFRVQSPSSTDLKWTAGLFYSYEDTDFTDYSVTYDTSAYSGFNSKYNWAGDRQEQTFAGFGQLTYPLPQNLSATLGLRYEITQKDLNYLRLTTRTDTGGDLSSLNWQLSDDWETLLPKGVISWQAKENAMVFFSLSKGYLAGGLNAWGDDPDTAKFDEQTSINYELGMKTEWFDKRLSLNAALFYIDIEDMHVWSSNPDGTYFASNAAKAHSQGVEVELKARPWNGFDIQASFGLTDAEFDDYSSYTGNTPPTTPAYTANLVANYRFDAGWYLRGEMQAFGETFYDEQNTVRRSPFQLYHAKAGYEAEQWDVYLFCENLLDEEYYSSMSGGLRNWVGKPRTVGLKLTFRL